MLRAAGGGKPPWYGVRGGLAVRCVGAKLAAAAVGRRGAVRRHGQGVSAWGLVAVRPGAAGRVGGGARSQAPVSTERGWARVASRTKRATLPARIRLSAR